MDIRNSMDTNYNSHSNQSQLSLENNVDNDFVHDLVSRLYRANWTDSCDLAIKIVPEKDADSITQYLINHRGWRERTVAAKLICAFNLQQFVSALIMTFIANPEFYTGIAFANLLREINYLEKKVLLESLLAACPDTDYGLNLKKCITNSFLNQS